MDIMLQRILELIGAKHGAKKELCDAIGLKANAVTEWEKGRSKSYTKYLPQIAGYYGVSLDWLSGLSEQKEKPSLELGEPIGDITGIPIIASVKAGYDGLAIEDDTGEFVQIPSVMLRGRSASECRAMHIRGDSMYPNMKDGDIVVVHIQSEVENGKVAVCIVNGDEGTIKRFFRYPDRVELWPDNQNVPKMILRGDQLESFHLYGQAIALIREDL